MAMNDAEYEAKKKEAKVYCRQVITAVKGFTPDNIMSVLDQDDLLQVTAWINALIVDLEENDEDARIAELEAVIESVKVTMNQNQTDVN